MSTRFFMITLSLGIGDVLSYLTTFLCRPYASLWAEVELTLTLIEGIFQKHVLCELSRQI
jgi:hypothetical protein